MDKNKIIEAAAKLVAKGAYDKAIKEYQKILDADPKEVRVLQKMGELYQKKNDNEQAALFFTKVAESYSTDGFFLKAVALYKQVLKLNPNLIEVNLRLAELHQQLQLMSEAMAYYQIVANHHDKAGDSKSSLDTLKKMVDLDPENVASRIKLAELYAREKLENEAGVEFKRAAEYLKRHNRIEDYLRVAERISALEPQDLDLARELAEAYLAKRDQKRALAKLQVCFKADARDVNTLRLLGTAFQGLGQTSKTLSVYKELAKVYVEKGRNDDAAGVWKQIEAIDPNDADLVAHLGPSRAVARSPEPVSAPAAAVPKPAPERAPAAPAPKRPPSSPAVAPPPPAAPAPVAAVAAVSKDQLGKLLTETDVYVKYGLHDKALEHLRKIFAVDPENLDAHEKAYNIYAASNNHAQASEQLLNVLRLCTRRADVKRAQPYLATILEQNPGHPEVGAFLEVLRVTGAPHPVQSSEPVAEDAILVDSSDEEIIVADAPEDALANEDVALQTATTGESDEVVADDQLVLADAEPSGNAIAHGKTKEQDQVIALGSEEVLPSSAEISAENVVMEMLDARPEKAAGKGRTHVAPDSGSHDFELESPTGRFGLGDEQEEESEEKTQIHQRPISELLAEASATQPGYFRGGKARPPEPELEPEPGSEPAADGTYELEDSPEAAEGPPEELDPEPRTVVSSSLLADAAAPGAAEAEAAEEEPVEGSVEDEPPLEALESSEEAAASAPVEEEKVEAPPDEEPASEECDEAAFFLDQGLAEEAREIIETILIAYPGHARATELNERLQAMEASGGSAGEAAAPAEDAPPPTVAPVSDDAAGAAGADGFNLADELASELGEAGSGEAAATPATDDYQVSVEEVFSEFKKGLEKVVKPEDVDTHYDLGIAYREMGLLDDAIGEFNVARQGCLGKKKEIDCLTMKGLLQVQKGDHGAAVEAFTAGLGSEFATGDTEKALRYELACAHEANGSPGKALFHFEIVRSLDAKYRDVARLITRLAATTEAEDDPLPPKGAKPGGPNGANGARGKGSDGGGSKGGGAAGGSAKPGEGTGPKNRKVGFV